MFFAFGLLSACLELTQGLLSDTLQAHVADCNIINADPASAQQAEGASDVPQAGTTCKELKNENAALKAELAALKAISRNNRADKKAVFAKGDICIIQGLVNQLLHNDHIARILSHDPARAIWMQRLLMALLMEQSDSRSVPSTKSPAESCQPSQAKGAGDFEVPATDNALSGTTQRAIAASSGSTVVRRRSSDGLLRPVDEKATTGADGKSAEMIGLAKNLSRLAHYLVTKAETKLGRADDLAHRPRPPEC